MREKTQAIRAESVMAYDGNDDYLSAELAKLDGLLRLRVAGFRRQMQVRHEASGQHLFVSDEEVERLLGVGRAPSPEADEVDLHRAYASQQQMIDKKVAESLKHGVFLGLPRLAQLFNLSPFEVQTLIICLAPELRRKYDRIYAYLQDDITRKRPSVDLVLELLCKSEAERWNARTTLSPQAALLHFKMLRTVEDPHSPSGSSGLATFLELEPRVLMFVLGHTAIDERLNGYAEIRRPMGGQEEPTYDDSVAEKLKSFARRNFSGQGPGYRKVVLHLQGPDGVGKSDLALAVCAELGCPMLWLDGERLAAQRSDTESVLGLALRESRLLQLPVYVAGADVFLPDDDQAMSLRKVLGQAIEDFGWLVFLGCTKPWRHRQVFGRVMYHSVHLPMPDVPAREAAWKRVLESLQPGASYGDLAAQLAGRFRLTPGRIREAIVSLANRRAVLKDEGKLSLASVAAASREQAHHNLAALARKVEPVYDWDDIILPEDKLAQLREICGQVRHRYRVFTQWGFGRKLSRGSGLSAIFTGPPGTGKTMAAEVIAGDLELDLYKVDLSRVVSKYIGETEKNLSRIFTEAEDSNAILFFDEADALFGKRTEITDAHDRYANIETSYLLQKMEEYEGVVILASNLRENIDDAFLRRIRFVVEFPFPSAASRLRIWQRHFPAEAPVKATVDYPMLAEQVQVAGGSIRNIALNSAFFAASDGGVIEMKHILRGTKREFEKLGKLWDERSFIVGQQ